MMVVCLREAFCLFVLCVAVVLVLVVVLSVGVSER